MRQAQNRWREEDLFEGGYSTLLLVASHFLFLLASPPPRPSFLSCRGKSFSTVQVNRVRRRGRRYPCASSLKLFPRNIVKRTAPVYVPISAGRKAALCRSWIDFAVICARTDYSLPFPTHFLDLFLLDYPGVVRDRRLVTI